MPHAAARAHARWPRVADACAMDQDVLGVRDNALMLGAPPHAAPPHVATTHVAGGA